MHEMSPSTERESGAATPVAWSMAARATLHCLTGCAIGEVLGMVIGTSAGLSNGATVALSVVLAFVFGYALTMRGVLRAGLTFRRALRVALAADTVSILVMEIVDNVVIVTVPGARYEQPRTQTTPVLHREDRGRMLGAPDIGACWRRLGKLSG